jgi:hypothetical protein
MYRVYVDGKDEDGHRMLTAYDSDRVFIGKEKLDDILDKYYNLLKGKAKA